MALGVAVMSETNYEVLFSLLRDVTGSMQPPVVTSQHQIEWCGISNCWF